MIIILEKEEYATFESFRENELSDLSAIVHLFESTDVEIVNADDIEDGEESDEEESEEEFEEETVYENIEGVIV